MFDKIQSVLTQSILTKTPEIQKEVKIRKKPTKKGRNFVPTASYGMKEPPYPTTKAQLDSYISWVYAAVNLKAKAVAGIELKLYRRKGDEIKIISEHPALDLLDSVNNRMTFYGLMNYSSIIRNLTGETFWYLVSNENDEPIEIFPWLRPDLITVIPSENREKFIEGYVYRTPNGQYEVPLDSKEVIQFFDPDPTNQYRGMSKVRAGAFAIESDKKAASWNWRFYKNNATPRGVLKVQNRYNQTQYEQLKASWEAGHQGEANSNKVAIIFTGNQGTDADFKEIGMSQRDMDFLKQREFSRDEILSMFGVPYSLINPERNVSRSTVEAAQINFLTNAVKPEMREWTEELNEFLLPRFKDSDGLFFDFKDPITENREVSLKTYDNGIRNGWLLINEVRAMEGLSPFKQNPEDVTPNEAEKPNADNDESDEEESNQNEEGDADGGASVSRGLVIKNLMNKKFNVRVKSTTRQDRVNKIVDEVTEGKLKRLISRKRAGVKKMKQVSVSTKERKFQIAISKQEKFLQSFYKTNYEPLAKKVEKEISEYLIKKYKAAPTKMENGVKVFKQNNKLVKEMTAWVDKKMTRLEKVYTGELMKEIHKTSEDNAKAIIKGIKGDYKGIVSNIAGFIKGYLSNITAFIFNESRRIKERITDNLLQSVMVSTAIAQASKVSLNRNTLTLSVLAHPRGLFRRTIEVDADKQGVSHFKLLAPSSIIPNLKKLGMTFGVLYLIKTKDQWNKYIDPKNNTNVVGGLGLHHGSQEYYLPISFEELLEEEEVSKEQRAGLEGKSIKGNRKKEIVDYYVKEINKRKNELEARFKESQEDLNKKHELKEIDLQEKEKILQEKEKEMGEKQKEIEAEQKEFEELINKFDEE